MESGEYHYVKLRCMNCGINLEKNRSKYVADLAHNHKKILGQWIDQQMVEGGKICLACLNKMENCEDEVNPPRELGHKFVCAGCGKALYCRKYKPRRTSYKLRHDEERLALLFSSYKQYKWCKIPYFYCLACDRRAAIRKIKIKKMLEVKLFKTEHKSLVDSEAEPTQSGLSYFDKERIQKRQIFALKNGHFILPGYKRVPISAGTCVMPNCRAPGLHITKSKRKLILLRFKSLLTRRASLCQYHKDTKEWDFGYNYFSINHVEDALNMSEKCVPIIDFNSNEMPDHICKYWTGLTVLEFKELYAKLNIDTSQFQSLKNALAIHLLRKKTGDSILKLANLFLISTQMLSKQLFVIEKCFETYNSEKNDKDVK